MNTGSSTNKSTNCSNTNGGLTFRPDTNKQLDDTRHRKLLGVKSESRATMSFPVALNTMLKTTTETGDTGEFTLKSSRPLPSRKPIGTQSEYRLQNYLQARPQVIDDRRRLPSYTRDATSEIVSIYETSSQKAFSRPQIFKNSDHRSYSMTQTSYLPNALSNHRSYTSLRSQPELDLLPRPRSPFLYPTRLKRLGFRPSSPIPREGRKEIGQRSELEHTIHENGTSARPAFPFNAQNSRPPSAAQLDGNSTYPFTLGRHQLGSTSYPPSSISTTDSSLDWNSCSETASPKVTPIGDAFRSTPSSINYHRRSPTSFTMKINKSHTPSPLYYDYTEDFGAAEAGDDRSAGRGTPSPIPYTINKVNHSVTQTMSGPFQHSDSSPPGSSTSADVHARITSSIPVTFGSPDYKHGLTGEVSQSERSINVTLDIIPLYLDRQSVGVNVTSPCEKNNSTETNQSPSTRDQRILSNSDISSGICQALSDTIDIEERGLNNPQLLKNKASHDQNIDNEETSTSNATSSFRLSTYLPSFPNPPAGAAPLVAEAESEALSQEVPKDWEIESVSVQKAGTSVVQAADVGLEFWHGMPHDLFSTKTFCEPEQDLVTGVLKQSTTTHDKRIRSSRYYSIDHGLSDLAQLISDFEFANRSFTAKDIHTQFEGINALSSTQNSAVQPSLIKPEDSLALQNKSLLQSSFLWEPRAQITKFRSDGNLRASYSTTHESSNCLLQENLTKSNSYEKKGGDIESCHESVIRLAPDRSRLCYEPPIIAPTAISPAKVLRLKNSVPQLMKALPPVPQSLVLESSLSPESSCYRTISSRMDSKYTQTFATVESAMLETAHFQSVTSEQDLEVNVDSEQSISLPSKFRIKSKLFDSQRSRSPASSRPWNLDENYPWYGRYSTIRLSSLRVILPGSTKSPKFKLRVTRPSTSPSGTIRINPEGRNSFDLRSPRDLFTSSSNLSSIFRQVGRHFSSRNSSNVQEAAPGSDNQISFTSSGSTQVNRYHGRNPDLLEPPSPETAHPMSPSEVRSFFSEDSSQIRGHNSLRKRISNLRARIPNRYISRRATSLTQNEPRVETRISHPSIENRSKSNINSEQEDEFGMPITSFRHQKLRSKVSRWFIDAGLAIRRGVKSHTGADVQCIPYR